MNLNWKAIIVGFTFAFLISLFSGLYLPKLGPIGPVIGAFIAVYMVEMSYTDGILYGGLPISIAGITSFSLLAFLSQNPANIQNASLNISPEELITLFYIVGAVSGFILFLFIGILSGIIAVAVQKKTDKKYIYTLTAFAVIILVFILSRVIHVVGVITYLN